MDKELSQYKNQTIHRVKVIEVSLSEVKTNEREQLIREARQVYRFHVVRVREFQHERLIHLLVTFFFGGLLLLSIAGGLFALTLAADPNGPLLNILAWTLLCPLLFVTEILYIRHYFVLENGTQSLYKLTQRLQTILRTTNKM
jgi:hypothetical protein